MQGIQKIKTVGGLQVDIDEKYVSATDYLYALNLEDEINANGYEIEDIVGGNAKVNTPTVGNIKLDIKVPDGVNTVLDAFESKLTNETYTFVHNSEGNHFIYRINGNKQPLLEMVCINKCLDFSDEQKYSISKNRVVLFTLKQSESDIKLGFGRTYLIWTTGIGEVKCLDIETSILTNSFQHPFYKIGNYQNSTNFHLAKIYFF